MSRARTLPTVLSKAVEASSSPATASDVTPAPDTAAAAETQPAEPDAALVEHYRVTRFCRYFRDSTISTWPEGHVIDSLNFDIADVRAQGLPIERCSPDAKNLRPSIGHWST